MMLVAFLRFPNVTQLDLTGPAQVLSRLGDAKIALVAKTRDRVSTDAGFDLLPTATFADVPRADILCPAGSGSSMRSMTPRSSSTTARWSPVWSVTAKRVARQWQRGRARALKR